MASLGGLDPAPAEPVEPVRDFEDIAEADLVALRDQVRACMVEDCPGCAPWPTTDVFPPFDAADESREAATLRRLAGWTEALGSPWLAARSFWPPDRSPGIGPICRPASTETLETPTSGVPGSPGGSQATRDKIATIGEAS